ncbi:Oidioi.mRNA.OKI2018_I69.PAR.g13198.t1.cds [Oikopleura dioica]|uniref:palmitoyl-protein hydrolase n=1 Tax=Oikopleura dioica TaxID=34765 RepID=A0ABN7SAG8_OIKDI|nr:Oidioi.mRNA.OKI2018_I69.PAR.g13198.t1.cds [Oikopleura dioica]
MVGSEVYVIGYAFSMGLVNEIHTEVRAFGKHYWFEKYGAEQASQYAPKEGFNLADEIYAGFTERSQQDFESYIFSIREDWTADKYRLFNHNCRTYSNTLIEYLFPGPFSGTAQETFQFQLPFQATNAKHYLLYQRAEAKVMETGLNLLGDWANAYLERSNPQPASGARCDGSADSAKVDSNQSRQPKSAAEWVEQGVQLFAALTKPQKKK